MGDGLKRARDATRATRGLAPAQPKLAEIAARIAAHLARFEADPALRQTHGIDGPRVVRYRKPFVKASGGRVCIRYVDYHNLRACIYKGQALAYLAWLDAGGVGRHWEWERQRASASKGESK